MEIKYIYTDLELFGAVFCWIAAFYLIITRSLIKKQYRSLGWLETAVGVMLVFDAFAWFYRGVPGRASFIVLTGANFMTFLANAVIPLCYAHYVSLSVNHEEVDKKMLYIACSLSGIAVILLIISQFTGYVYSIDPVTNLYHRGDGFGILTSLYVMEMLVGIFFILIYRKNITRERLFALLSFIVLPLLAALIQVFVYGFSLSNLACMISALVMFAQALDDNAKYMMEREMFISKQNKELAEMRTRIALSQIRPEFVYDTLNSIYDLCDRDIERAKEIIVHLTNYLRQNIDSIRNDELITFENELNHTMVYLELEKTRYPGRFEVEYHTDETDFMLPALTIQPLVENSLTHGIYKLPQDVKGKLIISVTKGNGYVKVEVKDNGVGFNVSQKRMSGELDREELGISIVKNRLKIMENAELFVKSREGEGTTVDIIIPTKNI